MASKRTRLKCPICGKVTDFFTDPLGPFCSPRCKLVDLGRWLGEDYRISDPLTPDHFAKYEEFAEGASLDRPEGEERG
jgi:uncharacterized protein